MAGLHHLAQSSTHPPRVEVPFYTIRFENGSPLNTARGRWTTYALGGLPNCPIFGFTADMYAAYLSREDLMIDYFLFDYVLALGYDRFPWFRELVDRIPPNNSNPFRLQRSMRAGDPEEARRAMEDESQWFYKCSYKFKLNLYPEEVLRGSSGPDASAPVER